MLEIRGNFSFFKTQLPGKWILVGEHSVFRGVPAIALPCSQFQLDLKFQPHHNRSLGVFPKLAEPLILDLLELAMKSFVSNKHKWTMPSGCLNIQSTIPMGAGLGSSAALCVALTRWILHERVVPEIYYFEFARMLEDQFHFKSSGMDIAVINANEPILFLMEGLSIKSIGIKTLPYFTLHDTGLRASTRECVFQVEQLRGKNLLFSSKIDELMSKASQDALKGLLLFDAGSQKEGLHYIQKAMKQAHECFYLWGLVPDAVSVLEKKLLSQGALAVKLTGAGNGGMLVALWE